MWLIIVQEVYNVPAYKNLNTMNPGNMVVNFGRLCISTLVLVYTI